MKLDRQRNLRARTIGNSCDVPTALTTDWTVPRPQCMAERSRAITMDVPGERFLCQKQEQW